MPEAREVLGKYIKVTSEWADPDTGVKWIHTDMESETHKEALETEEYDTAPRLLWFKGELYGWISWNSDRMDNCYNTENVKNYAIPASR